MNDYTPPIEHLISAYVWADAMDGDPQEREQEARRALAEHERKVAERAWDEGFGAGLNADHNPCWWPQNPYRADAIEGEETT